MIDEILFIVLGASVALLSSRVKAWIDRETAISNDLLSRRIQSLNDIWLFFIPVKKVFAKKISFGHQKWLEKYQVVAQKELDTFRDKIDQNQIVLPMEIIDELREIDLYLNNVLYREAQMPSEFVSELETHLNSLSKITNKMLSKRTHLIHLKFRT